MPSSLDERAGDLDSLGHDLDCVPSALAAQITEVLNMPVIGIGTGPQCDGQVLVLYDMLGITLGKPLRFTRNFMREQGAIDVALHAYVQAVKSGLFPGPEHSF
jgi:Ketopantoate hydroxymethyltransferase